MITGGNGGASTSVELYNPNTNSTCTLPSLPNKRFGHVAAGNLLCSGRNSPSSGLIFYKNCTEFSEGAWIATNHTLIDDRDFPGAHWIVDEGIYILGGWATSDLTSELVKFNGEVIDNPITVKYAIQ